MSAYNKVPSLTMRKVTIRGVPQISAFVPGAIPTAPAVAPISQPRKIVIRAPVTIPGAVAPAPAAPTVPVPAPTVPVPAPTVPAAPMVPVPPPTAPVPTVPAVEEKLDIFTAKPRQVTKEEKDLIIENIKDILIDVTGNNELVEIFTAEEYRDEWVNAFTHKSIDYLRNYEIYEKIGDTIMRACFVQLLISLNIKSERVISELEHSYVTKVEQAKLSEQLGLDKILIYDHDMCDINIHVKEDLIESLFGVIYTIGNMAYQVKKNIYGMGMLVCERFTQYIYGKIIDMAKSSGMPQTRLKEILDKMSVHVNVKNMLRQKWIGNRISVKFEPCPELRTQAEVLFHVKLPETIGEVVGFSMKSLIPQISEDVLRYLDSNGINSVTADKQTMEGIYPGGYVSVMEKLKSLGYVGYSFETLKHQDAEGTSSKISISFVGLRDVYGNVKEIILNAKGDKAKEIKRALILEFIGKK